MRKKGPWFLFAQRPPRPKKASKAQRPSEHFRVREKRSRSIPSCMGTGSKIEKIFREFNE